MLSAAQLLQMMWAGRAMSDLLGDRTSIIGLRNIVVHDYDAVDYSRHWAVIQNDLPRLIVELKKANS